ncbi:5-(carboxyamino)imidazole ribonucleotide mutase [Pontiellaceae bacterium B12219]|nr:5-(carboxyamino)imidazole ribonucleotide mutase [Pontiellaceae bacterium B12219]
MAAKKKPTVAIVMGSKTDWSSLEFTVKTLKEFGIESTVRVMSAHRTPHDAVEFAENAAKNGYKVIIGAAGGAAHLCGVLAGHTILPVIGIPVKGWSLDGLDSLLSTVQMPKGVPVATVAIGKAGAINAAILAVQMMAIGDASLKRKLTAYKKAMVAEVLASDAELQNELNA